MTKKEEEKKERTLETKAERRREKDRKSGPPIPITSGCGILLFFLLILLKFVFGFLTDINSLFVSSVRTPYA